jgi:hypothetical protein
MLCDRPTVTGTGRIFAIVNASPYGGSQAAGSRQAGRQPGRQPAGLDIFPKGWGSEVLIQYSNRAPNRQIMMMMLLR